MRITILDYGVGNLYSLRKALERRNVEPHVSKNLPRANASDGLILPGVGSFPAAAKRLSGIRQRLLDLVEEGVPILGICLGMQLFFDRSEEGRGDGLSLIRGEVLRLPSSVKTPQIGWNTLHNIVPNPLTEGLEEDSWVYFVHSYYPSPRTPEPVVAKTSYGINFAAAVASGNVFGTQFHPEKSGATGAKMLQNFISFCRR